MNESARAGKMPNVSSPTHPEMCTEIETKVRLAYGLAPATPHLAVPTDTPVAPAGAAKPFLNNNSSLIGVYGASTINPINQALLHPWPS